MGGVLYRALYHDVTNSRFSLFPGLSFFKENFQEPDAFLSLISTRASIKYREI
jgi:hypothetical protein